MVGDKPLIQHAIDEARKAGVTKFVFVVDDDPISIALLKKQFLGSDELNAHLVKQGMTEQLQASKACEVDKTQIFFAVQSDPKGMWDALLSARPYIKGDSFAVICPDDLMLPVSAGLAEMVKHHKSADQIVAGVERVGKDEVHKYGIVSPGITGDEKTVRIEGIVEKPSSDNAPSDIAMTGRYILPATIFDTFDPASVQDKKAEVGLAHAIHALCRNAEVTAVKTSGKRYDCGSKTGLALANIRAYQEDAQIGAEISAHIKTAAKNKSLDRKK